MLVEKEAEASGAGGKRKGKSMAQELSTFSHRLPDPNCAEWLCELRCAFDFATAAAHPTTFEPRGRAAPSSREQPSRESERAKISAFPYEFA